MADLTGTLEEEGSAGGGVLTNLRHLKSRKGRRDRRGREWESIPWSEGGRGVHTEEWVRERSPYRGVVEGEESIRRSWEGSPYGGVGERGTHKEEWVREGLIRRSG